MTTINRPIPFQGSDEEKAENLATHFFDRLPYDDYFDSRCIRCDCKPWHAAALYPCGQEPPRETVSVEGPVTMGDLHPGFGGAS